MPVFVLQGFCLVKYSTQLSQMILLLYSRTLALWTAWIVLFVNDSEIHLLATNYGWTDCFE